MIPGYSLGDIIAVSRLAFKVYTAYKDAPSDYRNISDEVKSLQIIIDKAAKHFQGTTLSDNNQQEGQEILKGCQNILEDLDCLIKKYNSIASARTGQAFRRIKLGVEDIATLRARLTSNTILLNGFIQRFEIPTINIECIVLILAAVNPINYTHGWTIFSVYTAQRQEAPVFLLLEAATLERLTGSYLRAFRIAVLRQR